MLASGRPPVFVGGVNRSGTSMIRQLLGSHPELAMPPTEFEFFRRARVHAAAALTAEQVATVTDEALAWQKVADWRLDPALVHARAQAGEHSARGVFVAFLQAYAAALGKPRFGDKTTGYECRLRTFDRWFGGDYVFVHLLRHPVSAFASTRWYGGLERHVDVVPWTLTWNASALIALRALRSRRGRYVAVRYEDVVADPEREVRRLCAVAGLRFHERMLEMADFAQKDNSSFPDVDPEVVTGAVRVRDVDRVTRVPEEQLATIRKRCRLLAAVLGYDVADATQLSPFDPVGDDRRLRLRASIAAAASAHRAVAMRSRLGSTAQLPMRLPTPRP